MHFPRQLPFRTFYSRTCMQCMYYWCNNIYQKLQVFSTVLESPILREMRCPYHLRQKQELTIQRDIIINGGRMVTVWRWLDKWLVDDGDWLGDDLLATRWLTTCWRSAGDLPTDDVLATCWLTACWWLCCAYPSLCFAPCPLHACVPLRVTLELSIRINHVSAD